MMNNLIKTLELIIHDISKNSQDYNQTSLLKVIGQFQKQILNLKHKDKDLKARLNELTLKEILECQKKLELELISQPTQKSKLIPLISGLASQKQKKKDLLETIGALKALKSKQTLKTKKSKTTLSSSEQENLQKLWLTTKDFSKLESELANINMNIIRAIVKPWNLKPQGRTKLALIKAVIDYIKRIKKISKLGT